MAVAVSELVERKELGVTSVAGQRGLGRTVTVPRIQKPGLALTGWPEQLHPHRVLVLGGTEIDYLADRQRDIGPKMEGGGFTPTLGIDTLLASDPACIVVCRGLVPPAELREAA